MKPAIDKKTVHTSFGDIAFLESGDATKPPVLFVHGIPTSGFLWRHVLRLLQDDLHCYAPDLMGLGDTVVDPNTCDFGMDAQAEMLAEFMAAQGHDTFSVVCHDQGGAAAQILAARQPDKIERLVLTDCVCYDNWPVPTIARLQKIARIPILPDLLGRVGFTEWVERDTALSSFRRGVYDPSKLSDAAIAEYLRPMRGSLQARQSFKAFLLAGDSRHTELAVQGLQRFDKPTLVVWAADDRYLSPSWGRKLAEEIPGVRGFELVGFCGHFWQEERPSEFAAHIGAFLGEQETAARTADETAPRKSRKPPCKKKLPVHAPTAVEGQPA